MTYKHLECNGCGTEIGFNEDYVGIGESVLCLDCDVVIAKRNALLKKESTEPEMWWWLSFADPTLPEGSQFLGVSLVKASGFVTASMAAATLGINPGGEVQGYPVNNLPVPEQYQNRLLTRAECNALDAFWCATYN